MSDDRVRPAAIESRQLRDLRHYVRFELHAHGEHHRARLERAGLTAGRLKRLDDLLPVLPITLAGVAPNDLVLSPDERSLAKLGDPAQRRRARWTRLTGQYGEFRRTEVAPRYKPILWYAADGVWLGVTAVDLDRLAELGRRLLEHVGVRPRDRLVLLVPPVPDLAFWQVLLGARRAGVPLVPVAQETPPTHVARLQPTSLLGGPDSLALVLAAVDLPSARTVVALGRPDDRARLAELAPPDAELSVAWSPPGVRALWPECREGAIVHTFPDTELVEVIEPDTGRPAGRGEPGRVVWTGIGWFGTAFLRLDTGLVARLHRDPCPHCGRTTPRLEPVPAAPRAAVGRGARAGERG